MIRAIIGIGSNIEPATHVAGALEALNRDLHVLATSPIRETEPIGRPGQPRYLNLAILIETSLSQDELLSYLKNLEASHGRIRTADRYAPRTLDLDLLVWDGHLVDEDIASRDFLQEAVRFLWPGILE